MTIPSRLWIEELYMNGTLSAARYWASKVKDRAKGEDMQVTQPIVSPFSHRVLASVADMVCKVELILS